MCYFFSEPSFNNGGGQQQQPPFDLFNTVNYSTSGMMTPNDTQQQPQQQQQQQNSYNNISEVELPECLFNLPQYNSTNTNNNNNSNDNNDNNNIGLDNDAVFSQLMSDPEFMNNIIGENSNAATAAIDLLDRLEPLSHTTYSNINSNNTNNNNYNNYNQLEQQNDTNKTLSGYKRKHEEITENESISNSPVSSSSPGSANSYCSNSTSPMLNNASYNYSFEPMNKRPRIDSMNNPDIKPLMIDCKTNEKEEPSAEEIDSARKMKKRLVWTPELHERFVWAVDELGGPNKASPKTIQVKMNVDGLTLQHIKSHLQKFRQQVRRSSRRSNNGTGKMNSVTTQPEDTHDTTENVRNMDPASMSKPMVMQQPQQQEQQQQSSKFDRSPMLNNGLTSGAMSQTYNTNNSNNNLNVSKHSAYQQQQSPSSTPTPGNQIPSTATGVNESDNEMIRMILDRAVNDMAGRKVNLTADQYNLLYLGFSIGLKTGNNNPAELAHAGLPGMPSQPQQPQSQYQPQPQSQSPYYQSPSMPPTSFGFGNTTNLNNHGHNNANNPLGF